MSDQDLRDAGFNPDALTPGSAGTRAPAVKGGGVAPTPATPPPTPTTGALTPPGAPNIPDPARPTLTLPSRASVGSVAGLLTGLLLYGMFLNYLRYGGAGVRGWFKAKFLNDPMTTPPVNALAGIPTAPVAPAAGSSTVSA